MTHFYVSSRGAGVWVFGAVQTFASGLTADVLPRASSSILVLRILSRISPECSLALSIALSTTRGSTRLSLSVCSAPTSEGERLTKDSPCVGARWFPRREH